MKSCRQRATRANTALVVIIDADIFTIDKRIEQLGRELKDAGLSPRTPNEQIIYLIPRRNIETWVLYLTGSQVDEETDYKPESGIDSKLRDAAAALLDYVRSHAVPPSPCPASLLQATAELKRLQ